MDLLGKITGVVVEETFGNSSRQTDLIAKITELQTARKDAEDKAAKSKAELDRLKIGLEQESSRLVVMGLVVEIDRHGGNGSLLVHVVVMGLVVAISDSRSGRVGVEVVQADTTYHHHHCRH